MGTLDRPTRPTASNGADGWDKSVREKCGWKFLSRRCFRPLEHPKNRQNRTLKAW